MPSLFPVGAEAEGSHVKGIPFSQLLVAPANAGDPRLNRGSGRYPGEGNGNLPQDSFLENPIDRGES